MILKQKDTRTEDIQELNRLLSLNISSKQRLLIERELKCLLSGNSGENSSAYYLDFACKHSKNWVLIHDLRIEHRGMVAQIDHLIINRFLNIHVLETKNCFHGFKITETGEFLTYYKNEYKGIESPIEQNKRHIDLLQMAIEDRNLAPNRLGISVSYKNYVLIAPNAKIDRPLKHVFDTSNILKSDAYVSHIEKEMDNLSIIGAFALAPKLVGTDTLEEFAQKLIRLHRPGKYNYVAKFGIDENSIQAVQQQPALSLVTTIKENKATVTKACEQCGVEIEEKVAYYCRINKTKFNGKTLCQTCQKSPAQAPEPQLAIESESKKDSCESCGTVVDSKVVYFCRLNKKKFDSKILCRDCQLKHSN